MILEENQMKKIVLHNTEIELLTNNKTNATMMFEIIEDSIQNEIPENVRDVELLIMAQTIAPIYIDEYFYVQKRICDCNMGICNNTGKCICCGEHIDHSLLNKKSYLTGKVINIQVKRVQDIIREEILKLGVNTSSYIDETLGEMTLYEIGNQNIKNSFFAREKSNTQILEKLFNQICYEKNIKKQFASNPYIFLYEFERIHNIDKH